MEQLKIDCLESAPFDQSRQLVTFSIERGKYSFGDSCIQFFQQAKETYASPNHAMAVGMVGIDPSKLSTDLCLTSRLKVDGMPIPLIETQYCNNLNATLNLYRYNQSGVDLQRALSSQTVKYYQSPDTVTQQYSGIAMESPLRELFGIGLIPSIKKNGCLLLPMDKLLLTSSTSDLSKEGAKFEMELDLDAAPKPQALYPSCWSGAQQGRSISVSYGQRTLAQMGLPAINGAGVWNANSLVFTFTNPQTALTFPFKVADTLNITGGVHGPITAITLQPNTANIVSVTITIQPDPGNVTQILDTSIPSGYTVVIDGFTPDELQARGYYAGSIVGLLSNNNSGRVYTGSLDKQKIANVTYLPQGGAIGNAGCRITLDNSFEAVNAGNYNLATGRWFNPGAVANIAANTPIAQLAGFESKFGDYWVQEAIVIYGTTGTAPAQPVLGLVSRIGTDLRLSINQAIAGQGGNLAQLFVTGVLPASVEAIYGERAKMVLYRYRPNVANGLQFPKEFMETSLIASDSMPISAKRISKTFTVSGLCSAVVFCLIPTGQGAESSLVSDLTPFSSYQVKVDGKSTTNIPVLISKTNKSMLLGRLEDGFARLGDESFHSLITKHTDISQLYPDDNGIYMPIIEAIAMDEEVHTVTIDLTLNALPGANTKYSNYNIIMYGRMGKSM